MAGTREQPAVPTNVPADGAATTVAEVWKSGEAVRLQPPLTGQRLQIIIPTKVLADALVRALCAPEVVKLYTDSLADAIKERLQGTEAWDTAEMTARIMEMVERKEFAEEVAQQIIDSAVEFKRQVAKGEKGGNDEEGPK